MAKDNVDDLKRQLAEVKSELAEVKAALSPKPNDGGESVEEYRDRLHQQREKAANAFRFSPAVQREMDAACGTSDMREIALRDNRAPQGPSSHGVIPSSQLVSNVRGAVPGGGSGWRDEIPFIREDHPAHPTPNVAACDRLMDAQDRRDLADRIEQERRLKLMEGK